jgi:HlyD family secretion protein
VVSRPKGSDESIEDVKKERTKDDQVSSDDTFDSDDLEEVVFLIKRDGTVKKRVVTTGIQDINHFEITSGLKEGEQVVTGPYNVVSKALRSGKKVTVVSKEEIFQNE